MFDFLIENWIEIVGALFALVYLFFSIRQNIWLWLCGILTSLFYIYVFAKEAFYADMGLQVYYLFVSVYGWIIWARCGVHHNKSELPVCRLSISSIMRLIVMHSVIYLVILALLLFLPAWLDVPSSSLPYLDALTTSGGIVATWMLAKKYLENWIIWIAVDFISMGMYIYKGLTVTSVLFAVYTFAAIIGYRAWLKSEHKVFVR